MTESPLFEVIPPAKRTYDELVELNHYLNQRCSEAEDRLAELSAAVYLGEDDLGILTPSQAIDNALDMIREWHRHDEENPDA